MSYSPSFRNGDWKALCDRCGFLYKASQLRKDWQGLYLDKECWEVRHPQDFQRGVKDDPSVEWTRPEGTDVETDNSSWLGRTDVPTGNNDGSL
jgi:hypothetical protein